VAFATSATWLIGTDRYLHDAAAAADFDASAAVCRPTDSSGNCGDADCWLLNTKSQY